MIVFKPTMKSRYTISLLCMKNNKCKEKKQILSSLNTSISVVPIHVRWSKNGTIKTKFIATVFQDVFAKKDRMRLQK